MRTSAKVSLRPCDRAASQPSLHAAVFCQYRAVLSDPDGWLSHPDPGGYYTLALRPVRKPRLSAPWQRPRGTADGTSRYSAYIGGL